MKVIPNGTDDLAPGGLDRAATAQGGVNSSGQTLQQQMAGLAAVQATVNWSTASSDSPAGRASRASWQAAAIPAQHHPAAPTTSLSPTRTRHSASSALVTCASAMRTARTCATGRRSKRGQKLKARCNRLREVLD